MTALRIVGGSLRKKQWCSVNKTKIPCEWIAVHIVKISTQKKTIYTKHHNFSSLYHLLKKHNIQKYKVRKGGRKKERLKGKREEGGGTGQEQ